MLHTVPRSMSYYTTVCNYYTTVCVDELLYHIYIYIYTAHLSLGGLTSLSGA